MLNTTLAALQAEVQKRADIQNETTFIPLSDITEYINRAIARVHGLLAISGEPHYRTLSSPFATVSNQQVYYTTGAIGVPAGTNILPTDIFLIYGLDTQVQNQRWLPCERMNFERRNDYQRADYFWPIVTFLYDFSNSGVNQQIFVQPPPQGQQLRVWYYPIAPQLVNAGDTWDSNNRWDSYVIDWAARLCAEKDENDFMVGRLDMSIAEMEAAIKREAESRMLGAAPKIRRARYRRGVWPWGAPGNIP